MYTFVEEGTVNADSGWICTNDGAIVLATGLLVDVGSGAFFEQTPRRVDVRLEPTR